MARQIRSTSLLLGLGSIVGERGLKVAQVGIKYGREGIKKVSRWEDLEVVERRRVGGGMRWFRKFNGLVEKFEEYFRFLFSNLVSIDCCIFVVNIDTRSTT